MYNKHGAAHIILVVLILISLALVAFIIWSSNTIWNEQADKVATSYSPKSVAEVPKTTSEAYDFEDFLKGFKWDRIELDTRELFVYDDTGAPSGQVEVEGSSYFLSDDNPELLEISKMVVEEGYRLTEVHGWVSAAGADGPGASLWGYSPKDSSKYVEFLSISSCDGFLTPCEEGFTVFVAK